MDLEKFEIDFQIDIQQSNGNEIPLENDIRGKIF